MVPENDAHTGHQELVPGHLAVPEHPRQSSQGIGAEAGACKARPANGVRHQNGRDTKGQPGPLHGGHAAAWLMRVRIPVEGCH